MSDVYKVLLCCVLWIPSAYAEDHHIAMKATPFGNLLFEVAITPHVVAAVDLTLNNMSMGGWSGNISRASSVGLRSSWHKRGAFAQGAYASMYLDHIFFDYDAVQYDFSNVQTLGSGETQAIGFISGYQWLFDESLSFNIGGGYGFVLPTSISTTQHQTNYDKLGNIVSQQNTTGITDIPASGSFVLDMYIGFVF